LGRILFVGRITPIKGIENLIESVAIIINKGYDVHARIVGPFEDLSYKKELVDLSRKLNVLKYIDFVGELYEEHLKEEYSKCSVFVLPSFDESNPIVLLEAMAAGKIIVATNVGGIPYLIKNNINGFLVDYGDNQKMAETIIEVFKNKENYKKMEDAAKKTAEQYKWMNIVDKTYNLYIKAYKNYYIKNG
jgi:glycosyltransferase involved in cell wall biosynthesis